MSVKVEHLGCVGHCIVGKDCHWRRHTQIGDAYCVSSIGDYYFDKKRQTLGAGADSWFETMVFKTQAGQESENEGCGCRAVQSWSEIDGTRYATAGEAQAGHNKFVNKYRALATKDAK